MRGWGWAVCIVLAAAGVGAWATRGMGYTSRAIPGPWETRLMRAARHWGTPAAVRTASNPVPADAETLREGRAHWADHCATCHGNDGRGTPMGRALYPPAPDMREASTQGLSDGELFYVIERGLPLTGMPAWGNGTDEGERQSWALVRFIRTLPTLTADDVAEMESLNPKSAAEVEQARKMKEFLNGK